MSFIDEILEKENCWAIGLFEQLTLETGEKDSTNGHESFFLEQPQDTCSSNKTLELIAPSAKSTYEDYNHLKALTSKMFRKMVVHAFVYHKYCKTHSCTSALTMKLRPQ